MDWTSERWKQNEDYCAVVFGAQDDHLAGIMPDAVRRGMPDIAVNAEVGRLLMILTSLARARLAIELGTLAGYSGIWIARGLAPAGRLITIEKEPDHASFACEQFERAGVADRVDVRVGAALDLLPDLAIEVGDGGADVVFLDAVKSEYPDYWTHARPLIAPGGLIIADNALGGQWSIQDRHHPNAIGMDRFNRAVAADPDFEAVIVPIRSGVLIGRRVR
ncbi:MAG: O-methyltransferase [Planctomycetota bacterium]|jgi:predicted O-methyltransferase YrrM